jgi:hypothetical protein
MSKYFHHFALKHLLPLGMRYNVSHTNKTTGNIFVPHLNSVNGKREGGRF